MHMIWNPLVSYAPPDDAALGDVIVAGALRLWGAWMWATAWRSRLRGLGA